VDAILALANVGLYNFYAETSLEDEQLLMRPRLRESQNKHGGQLKVKIHILFYGENS
jgi:hypothetical protein